MDNFRICFFYFLPIQLNSILKNIHFNNGAGHEVLIEYGEVSAGYDIINWIVYPNFSVIKPKFASFSPNHEFTLTGIDVVWNDRLKQVGKYLAAYSHN